MYLHKHYYTWKYLQQEYSQYIMCCGVTVFKVNMTLLRYLKPTDGLPDPKGSLSSSMHPQAIARRSQGGHEKCIKKTWTVSGVQCRHTNKIAKYARHYGITAASHFFSRKLESLLGRVQYIHKMFGLINFRTRLSCSKFFNT